MGYNGMVSSYAWLCGGEFPSQRLRSFTFGIAASVGFFGAWLTTFTAPYFINPDALNWGPKYGYIWAPSCVIGALWTYFYLPEVKNRTFEEIDEMVSSVSRLFGEGLLMVF
jgi:SP family sugar:H+ symporter-like MFS transporter